ncbi:MAG: Na+/H+ antiporter NhaC family protein, partial [Clostridia bacterium]|nr:Na+/H+ antiporter NhaC family protein [Clostridia bacterium]
MQFKKILPKVLIVAFVVGFGVLCAFMGDINNPVGTLWSLFPPVIAIGLALLTKEVYSSLFIGILAGGLLATNFNPIHTIDSVTTDGLISAVSGTSGIFVFLVVLGVIVALLNKAGGAQAFGRWAAKHVKGKIGASLATFAFGVLIFIDD